MRGIEVIKIALKELGVKESPPGSNSVKYNFWFYGKAVLGAAFPWCGTFVSWCYYMAGYPLGNIGYTRGFAGCQTAYTHFKDCLTTSPVTGDIILWSWKKNQIFNHTSLYASEKDLREVAPLELDKAIKRYGKLEPGEVWSVEGNTGIGNDSDGGEVMLRKRNESFATFVHVKE